MGMNRNGLKRSWDINNDMKIDNNDKDKIIMQLRHQLKLKDDELQLKNHELQAKDKEIEELKQQNHELTVNITSLNSTIQPLSGGYSQEYRDNINNVNNIID